jgi:hypothetical protein
MIKSKLILEETEWIFNLTLHQNFEQNLKVKTKRDLK